MGIFGTDLTVNSFIGFGRLGLTGIAIFLFVSLICIMLLGILLYIFWLTGFNHRVIIFDRLNSGLKIYLKKGGLRRNFKSKKLEFKVKGEKCRVNNYDKNKVILAGKKGTPTIFCFRTKNDLLQILDIKFLQMDKKGKGIAELKFLAESLGQSDWEGDYDERTADMFTIRDFWKNYGRDVVYISALVTFAMIMLIAILKG